jgi:hypothetical protein
MDEVMREATAFFRLNEDQEKAHETLLAEMMTTTCVSKLSRMHDRLVQVLAESDQTRISNVHITLKRLWDSGNGILGREGDDLYEKWRQTQFHDFYDMLQLTSLHLLLAMEESKIVLPELQQHLSQTVKQCEFLAHLWNLRNSSIPKEGGNPMKISNCGGRIHYLRERYPNLMPKRKEHGDSFAFSVNATLSTSDGDNLLKDITPEELEQEERHLVQMATLPIPRSYMANASGCNFNDSSFLCPQEQINLSRKRSKLSQNETPDNAMIRAIQQDLVSLWSSKEVKEAIN